MHMQMGHIRPIHSCTRLHWAPPITVREVPGPDFAKAATHLSGAKEIEETAQVRASARHLLADIEPVLATLLEQARGQPSPSTDGRR